MRWDHVGFLYVPTNYEEGYKGQGGWETVLGRFPRGKGTLLDLEFLGDGMWSFHLGTKTYY